MKIFRYSLVTRNLCRNASLRQLSSKWLTTHFSTFWCYVWKAWFFVLQFVCFVRVFPYCRFLAQNRHNFEIHAWAEWMRVTWESARPVDLRIFPQRGPPCFQWNLGAFWNNQNQFEILDHHDHHVTNTGERLSATRGFGPKKPRNETVEQLAALQSQYQLLGSCWRSWCKKGSWRFLKGQKNHI